MEFTYKNLKEISNAINATNHFNCYWHFSIYKINKRNVVILFEAKIGVQHNEKLKSFCKSIGMQAKDLYKGSNTDYFGKRHYIRVSYYKKDHDTLLALLRMK